MHKSALAIVYIQAIVCSSVPQDCYPVVQKTTLLMMERLQQMLQLDVVRPPSHLVQQPPTKCMCFTLTLPSALDFVCGTVPACSHSPLLQGEGSE